MSSPNPFAAPAHRIPGCLLPRITQCALCRPPGPGSWRRSARPSSCGAPRGTRCLSPQRRRRTDPMPRPAPAPAPAARPQQLSHGQTVDAWPEPDLSILGRERPPPPAFPLACLGPAWSDWAHTGSTRASNPCLPLALIRAQQGWLIASVPNNWKAASSLVVPGENRKSKWLRSSHCYLLLLFAND
jgi:hypothetical protein